MGTLKVYSIKAKMLENLSKQLNSQPDIISFESQPLLVSLISCLGLKREIGVKKLDRLSPFFGVEVGGVSPWEIDLVSHGNSIGIRCTPKNGRTLKLRHRDLLKIIHPLSLCARGKLKQVVIFPAQVAQWYKSRGVELVVVKPWAQTSVLSLSRLNYLETNIVEIRNGYAKIQVDMMSKNQLAFMGTHDLVDHLLGGTSEGWKSLADLIGEFKEIFKTYLANPRESHPSHLLLAYLVGVLLDDLAQPVNYKSKRHEYVLAQAIKWFKKIEFKNNVKLSLDDSFHQLVADVRKKNLESVVDLEVGLTKFLISIGGFKTNDSLIAV